MSAAVSQNFVSPSLGGSLLEWSSGPFTWLLLCPPSLPRIFSLVCFSCFAAPSLPLHPLSFLCTCPDHLKLASLSFFGFSSDLLDCIPAFREQGPYDLWCVLISWRNLSYVSLQWESAVRCIYWLQTGTYPTFTTHTRKPASRLKLKCSSLNPGPQTETSTNCFHLVTWNKHTHTHTFIFLQILH